MTRKKEKPVEPAHEWVEGDLFEVAQEPGAIFKTIEVLPIKNLEKTRALGLTDTMQIHAHEIEKQKIGGVIVERGFRFRAFQLKDAVPVGQGSKARAKAGSADKCEFSYKPCPDGATGGEPITCECGKTMKAQNAPWGVIVFPRHKV